MTSQRRLLTSVFRPQFTHLEDRTTPAAAFAITGNTLLSFDTSTPGATTSVAVTGLGAGENLVGIDVRPQNGQLYGLTSNGAGAVRLYVISPTTGTAVGLGAGPVQFDDGAGNPVAIAGTNFGVDFNPTVDRFRIVTNAGVNFRINPNTGLIIDGNTTTNGVNPDGTAYTNNTPNATVTTQYTIDASTGKLFIQNPPNAGTQVSGLGITVAGVPLAFTGVNGFDIGPGVAVTTSNAAATGSAFAVLTVGTGSPTVFSIDLATGNATSLGAVGGTGTTGVSGFAVVPNSSTTGIPFVGISGGNLIRFSSLTPGTVTKAAITGLGATETVVAMDRRPSTGQYYVLVQDTTASSVRLGLLDPQGGAVSALSGTVNLVTAAGQAIAFPTGTNFGIDFNPTVDKLRVVASTGTNFRIDPSTGSAVDGDTTVAGTQPDGALSGGTNKVDATAYTNNFHKATVTTQYTLDASTDKLFIQNPPNAGTQTNGVSVTLDGKALDFTDANGFDIPSNVKVTASNTAATGLGFAALTVSGATALYTIDLTTGAATKLGAIDAGTAPLVGLSVSEAFIPNTGLVGSSDFTTGTDAGTAATAKVFGPNGVVKQTIATPFGAGSFTGGVRTATGDFNGDGVADIVVGTGPGIATDVRIIDGRTNTEIGKVAPFEAGFTGGVFVAAGDVTGDGRADLVITPDQGGGPRVRIFRSGNVNDQIADFFGIDDPNFRGGARAAVGDVNGDGIGDLGVAAGFGGGPRVAIFNGSSLSTTPVKLGGDFFAFENTLRNGVFLALGDTNGDGKADIIAGGGPGGGPRVTAFDGSGFVASGATTSIANFFAGDAANRGGIRVAVKDLNADSRGDIVVGSGTGAGTRVTAYSGATLTANATPPELLGFDAFTGTNGVFVG